MPKQILHKEEARRALERGVNILANTVTVTLSLIHISSSANWKVKRWQLSPTAWS